MAKKVTREDLPPRPTREQMAAWLMCGLQNHREQLCDALLSKVLWPDAYQREAALFQVAALAEVDRRMGEEFESLVDRAMKAMEGDL